VTIVFFGELYNEALLLHELLALNMLNGKRQKKSVSEAKI